MSNNTKNRKIEFLKDKDIICEIKQKQINDFEKEPKYFKIKRIAD